MTATNQAHQEFETTLLQRLASSDRFKIYQDAFRTATGLPLRLVSADPEDWCLDDQKINRSPFCEALNLCKTACGACLDTNRRLMKEAEVNGPTTCHCFAGLCATAVPVKMGASVIGFLKTGQVFSRTPTEDQFESILGAIGRKTLNKSTRDKLEDRLSADPLRRTAALPEHGHAAAKFRRTTQRTRRIARHHRGRAANPPPSPRPANTSTRISTNRCRSARSPARPGSASPTSAAFSKIPPD